MGSQRENSLDVHLLGPRRLLTSILFATALVLPALSLDSLLCYYCPLQYKGKSCPNITSECLPHQRCSISGGHYGSVSILSSQGCLDTKRCGSHDIISYRGVEFNVSHTCCCKDKCNSRPKSDANPKMLIGINIDYTKTTNVLGEELWDSCANYTSGNSTLPATAS